MTFVDYSLLMTMSKGTHSLIVERSTTNVTFVDYALVKMVVCNRICALILERSPSNVTYVDHALL